MSFRLRMSLAALLLGLAALPACNNGQTPAALASGLVPEIDSLEAVPRTTSGKTDPISLVVTSDAAAGSNVTYRWSATNGLLSADTGAIVKWQAASNDGTVTPGQAEITVVASAGAYSSSAKILILIKADGSAVTDAGPGYQLPSSSQPIIGGAATSAAGASGAGSPKPSASPTATPGACAVTGLTPSWVAPGGLLFVRGTNLPAGAAVLLGGQALTVVKAGPAAIAVQLPATTPITNDAQTVTVTGCGGGTATAGTFTTADTSSFGDLATTSGQGLLGEVEEVDGDTQQVPDLTSFTPIGSFIVADLDVANQRVSPGFPLADHDLTRNFAIRYSGTLNVPTAGDTHFSLVATDGAKLYIDGKLVVDADVGSPFQGVDGDVTLTAGAHALRVDYLQLGAGTIDLTLYWALAGGAETAIPASAFTNGIGP